MWNEIEADIKCTRGDCLHAAKQPTEHPCYFCTCNRKQHATQRKFRYEGRNVRNDRERNETTVRKEEPDKL